MNLYDLMNKLKTIEEGSTSTVDQPLMGETPVEECGMAIMPQKPPAQSDSVTMNVSMNGSGAGGIKDLMNILKNIEQADHTVEPHSSDEHDTLFGDGYENEPDTTTFGIDAVTRTGDDMHSKGAEAPKVNGGGNPMQEALVQKLAQMYEEVKAKKEKEPEGTYSSKRHETDGQRIARLAKEKRQAQNKERMKNDYNAEMER